MKKKQIWGLVVAVVLFIAVGVSSVLINSVSDKMAKDSAKTILSGDFEFTPPSSDYVAVVKVEGTIQQQSDDVSALTSQTYMHTTTMEYIDKLIKDKNNKGILLYVDSPGGTVYESEELYNKLMDYKDKTKRPIWDYMAHYAASGGYMASVATDKIYANKNTVTGSIGVIMAGYDMTGLYEKLGIKYYSVTSGKYKDSTKMTPEQMAIYQTQVDETYGSFVEKVAAGRNMSEEDVKTLADGRIYTATQAKENGLIDEISSYEDMKKDMSKKCGTDNYYEPENKVSSLAWLFSDVKKLIPKSEAQTLIEESEKLESGVPMYYAEQLQ